MTLSAMHILGICLTLVLIALVGKVFFKERLSRRQLVAMGVLLAALILLNL